MTKPCNSCDAYSHEKCGVLVSLRAMHPADHDGKAADIAEVLFQRPCQFSLYIMRMAKHFVDTRGLRSQVEPDDIHNDVAVELLGRASRWARFVPTYEDFRACVTRMTRNAVHRTFVQKHGVLLRHLCFLLGRQHSAAEPLWKRGFYAPPNSLEFA